MSESTYSVHDDGDLHRYRTEIPNIIFRLGLTPYELTLYAHLKQTAGDGGQCWKSTGTLARETGMSAGTISKAKDGLTAPRQELAGKSLIAVREESGHNGGRPRHYITLTDVWPENMTMRGRVEEPTSTGNSPSSPHELGVPQVHHMNAQVHHMNFPSSPHELKKEQSIKKEQKEEERPPSHKNETPPPVKHSQSKPYSAELTAFWKAYPPQGRARGSESTTSAVWANLTPSDRDAAGRGLTAALSNSQFMAFPPAPHRWLKERRWETFLDGLPLDAPVPSAPPRPVSAVKAGAASSAEYYTARIDGIFGGHRA